MRYAVQPLDITPAELDGLSERQIASHYQNTYGGAVRRLNAIAAEIAKLEFGMAPVSVVNGLKREELIVANSMLLHELYFDGLGGSGEPAGEIAAALERDFGSFARWRGEFAHVAMALAGGSGWVLLMRSRRDGRLVNQWASDYTRLLADGQPLLALDMYEHAYHLDYGARAGAYVEAFLRNVDWAKVGARYAAMNGTAHAAPDPARNIAPEDLRERIVRDAGDMLVVDVRRRPVFMAAADMIKGAIWRDPERLDAWADLLPKNRDVIIYCVYGHNVSQDVCAALRARGIAARQLLGGIAAWHAIAGPTAPRAKAE